MSKSKYRYTLSDGTYLVKDLLSSTAYFALSGVAPQVLTIFHCKLIKKRISKRARKSEYIVLNAKNLFFTYAEAKSKYGLTKPRFTRAIDQLVEKGFIDIVRQGGGLEGDYSVYAISNRWEKYGTIGFKEAKRKKGRRVSEFFIGKNHPEEKKPRDENVSIL